MPRALHRAPPALRHRPRSNPPSPGPRPCFAPPGAPVLTRGQISPSAGGAAWFAARHDRARGPSGSVLRLLYYPGAATAPASDPPPGTAAAAAAAVRAGAHTDYGSLTLLFQRAGGPAGLELRAPAAGAWARVPPVADALLVNVGDLLSFWTAGLLRSTVHRVVVPGAGAGGEGRDGRGGEDRYSIAYFCHPVDETRLVTVPSRLVREFAEGRGGGVGAGGGGGLDGVVTAKEHLDRRLAATYGIREGGQAG